MSELFTYRTAEEVAAESTHNDNPFGLVYAGAITENVPGKVNIIPISYMLDGLKLVANVYVPAGYDKSAEKKYAGIVVAHPNGGVKEQVAGLYAQNLAEAGYVTLAFDAAYPVSYTHLDVYKRQVFMSSVAAASMERSSGLSSVLS